MLFFIIVKRISKKNKMKKIVRLVNSFEKKKNKIDQNEL